MHQSSFIVGDERTPVLLLGGRSWELVELDWRRRLAYVAPAEDPGRSRWTGSGPPLGFALCRAMRDVLCSDTSPAILWARAEAEVAALLSEHEWAAPGATSLVNLDGRRRWWTFAGTLANHELRWRLGRLADGSRASDELSIPLREGVTPNAVSKQLAIEPAGQLPIDPTAVEELKFGECLPAQAAEGILRARVRDREAVEACHSERIQGVAC